MTQTLVVVLVMVTLRLLKFCIIVKFGHDCDYNTIAKTFKTIILLVIINIIS